MPGDPKLKREVLPPQKQSSGLGVMVVAAAAMFFAVASSAFVLRARMARSHCDYVRTNTPIIIQMDTPSAANDNMPTAVPRARVAPTDDGCGAPVVTHNADGTDSYSFTPCPDLEIGSDNKPIHGVTVRNISLVPDGR